MRKVIALVPQSGGDAATHCGSSSFHHWHTPTCTEVLAHPSRAQGLVNTWNVLCSSPLNDAIVCDLEAILSTPSAQRAELADIQHQLEVLKTRERDLEAALALWCILSPPHISKCLPFHSRPAISHQAPLVLAQVVSALVESYSQEVLSLRRLELQASDRDCEALCATCSDFPVLRELAMMCYGSGPGPFSIFRSAPALCGIRLPYRSFPSGVFFQSYLREMSVGTLVDMLTDLPQLLHLDTRLALMIIPPSSMLVCREDAPDPPVLDYLTLPKLRCLELHHPPQFQALGLGADAHSPDFSGIISLDLDTYVYLDSFTYGLQDTTLLPHLRSLSLTSWRDGMDYASLVWCLRIRNHDRKVLKSFKLDFDNPLVSELAGLPTDDLILAELESIVAGRSRFAALKECGQRGQSITQKDSHKVREQASISVFLPH
ncbi:hypothetical protein B0H10DRAFT_2014063 [Mycena sp. CBHHK59/15]|nr:hypothetical protein B0H10DRAFT_2014063 [Mycena sp. CBHHK59/15]